MSSMSGAACSLEIPPAIAASRLYSAGGCMVLSGLFAEADLAALRAEALTARPAGIRSALAVSDAAEGRGGAPARAFRSAPGGAAHWQVFGALALMARLAQICGLTTAPTGGGSYTYYEQPGDFLALHRDILTCDLAVVTCLETTPIGGGGLLVYPGHMAKPLSNARAAGRLAATPATLRRGDAVVLLGGIVPHEVTPMEPDQERIVSIMCYRILSAA